MQQGAYNVREAGGYCRPPMSSSGRARQMAAVKALGLHRIALGIEAKDNMRDFLPVGAVGSRIQQTQISDPVGDVAIRDLRLVGRSRIFGVLMFAAPHRTSH